MIVHYFVGRGTACRRGEMGTTDRALVTCKRCHAFMDAGAERPLQPYLAPGIKRRGPKRKAQEPKVTMTVNWAPGIKVVLDAPQYRLKRTEYP